jgi:hypothetical protein
MLNPTFTKGDHISVRATKFTILEVQDSGYLATRGGQKYRLDSSEQFQTAHIEKGDTITAYRHYKWKPGVCMSVAGSDCVIQLDNVQLDFKLSGVRF